MQVRLGKNDSGAVDGAETITDGGPIVGQPIIWPFGVSIMGWSVVVLSGIGLPMVQELVHVIPGTHPVAEAALCAHTCVKPVAHDAVVQLYSASEPLVETHNKPAAVEPVLPDTLHMRVPHAVKMLMVTADVFADTVMLAPRLVDALTDAPATGRTTGQ